MVGVQAVTNVLQGERYKKVSKEIKAYCRGEYGRTPAPIDPEIKKMILGDEQPIEGRYADTLAPVVDATREKLGDLAKCDEDVLSYIAFPNLAEKFLEERKAKEENVATYSIVEAEGGTVMGFFDFLRKRPAEGEVAVAAAAPVAAPAQPLAPGSAGQLKLYDTPPKAAAMIMAIVADTLGKPLNELRFISIKEVK